MADEGPHQRLVRPHQPAAQQQQQQQPVSPVAQPLNRFDPDGLQQQPQQQQQQQQQLNLSVQSRKRSRIRLTQKAPIKVQRRQLNHRRRLRLVANVHQVLPL